MSAQFLNLQLNSQQKEAVLHDNGPLLVLAGAGTGKTKVLTQRIIHIINSYAATPYQILAVTFTNKAAFEMKQRIISEIGADANNIWAGTFHSIASKILKRHGEIVGLRSDFTIIDTDDQLRLIKQIVTDLDIDTKDHPPKNYHYQIERFKDKVVTPQDLAAKGSDPHGLPELAKTYALYQEKLKFLNSVDFGDLLMYNLEIFKKSAETLNYYQNKFHYILVDEYQDTNNSQYQWLLNLAGKNQNICAVGDDDQSIYSWRGAQITNILRFEKDFKNTKIIRLEQNYRSTSNILKCASHVIKNNSTRHEKTLWSEAEAGEKIKLSCYIDERNEASGIIRVIDSLQGKQKLSNMAILVRAGYQTRCLEEALIAENIAYKIIGGLRFYERKEIKDVIAYLRLVFNENDDLALQRIVNLPKRGIGNVTLDNLSQEANNMKSSLFVTIKRDLAAGKIKGKAKDSLQKFISDIEKWREFSKENRLEELAKNVLHDSGYLAMWHSDKTPDAKTRIENLKEFISSLEEFPDLSEFLEHVSLVSENENKNSANDMVNIMTIHGAKGLEFETVFIPGLEEGVFPSSRSMDEKTGVEEERRLFYVAVTRARRDLYLSYAQNRVIYGNFTPSLVSRFVAELPDEILEKSSQGSYYNQNRNQNSSSFRSGNSDDFDSTNYLSSKSDFNSHQVTKILDANDPNDFLYKRIFHQKFGYGKVVKVNDDKLDIIFEKAGSKTLMKNFVKLA